MIKPEEVKIVKEMMACDILPVAMFALCISLGIFISVTVPACKKSGGWLAREVGVVPRGSRPLVSQPF